MISEVTAPTQRTADQRVLPWRVGLIHDGGAPSLIIVMRAD